MLHPILLKEFPPFFMVGFLLSTLFDIFYFLYIICEPQLVYTLLH